LAEADLNNNREVIVYVRLLSEGTEVSRPTHAIPLGDDLFRLLPTEDYDHADEEWEFTPGSIVRVESRPSSDGPHLIAKRA